MSTVEKSSISPAIASARSFARKTYPTGSQEITECPLCKHNDYIPDCLGGDTNWAVCKNCQCVFKMSVPTAEEMRNFYAEDYRLSETGPDYPLVSHRRTQVIRTGRQFALLFMRLSEHKRFLDIGCGLGWSVHAADFMELEAYGVEPGEMDKKFAMDALGLKLYNTPEDLPVRDFDLILMSHVLEHIIDPIGYLKMLADDYMPAFGRIIIEVPTTSAPSAWSSFHAILFTTKTLVYTIEQAGLVVELIRSKEIDPQYPAHLMWAIARKDDKQG